MQNWTVLYMKELFKNSATEEMGLNKSFLNLLKT